MKKFKLRPELKDWKYWLHIPIIALVIQILLIIPSVNLMFVTSFGNPFTFPNILGLSILIILGDILAHSLLRLD